jgi:AraC-like DNA-binding protein
VHQLARGALCVRDYVCPHTAASPVIEGAYARTQIGVMLAGAFHARSSQGQVLLGPGALMLKNAGCGYEYRHVDDGGDRALVFDYAPELLGEVAEGLGVHVRAQRPFGAISVPASPASVRAVALTWEAVAGGDPELLREASLAVAAVALAHDRPGARPAAPSAVHARRIAEVLRHVEANSAEDCSLDALAARAELSSFHFLRVFRAVTGQTPRQLVIATRLRAAATALRGTIAPVTELALEAGFGDLSHFHASFARAFGVTPRAYRVRGGGARSGPERGRRRGRVNCHR